MSWGHRRWSVRRFRAGTGPPGRSCPQAGSRCGGPGRVPQAHGLGWIVLVLALDTATPAVTAGVVEVAPGRTAAATRVRPGHPRRPQHGELLMPEALAACAEAGVRAAGRRRRRRRHRPGPVHRPAGRDGDRRRPRRCARTSRSTASARSTRSPRRPRARRRRGPSAVRRPMPGAARSTGPPTTGGRRLSGPHVEAPASLADRIPGLGVVAAAGPRGRHRPAGGGPGGTRPRRPRACARSTRSRRCPTGPAGAAVPAPAGRIAPGPRKPVTTG